MINYLHYLTHRPERGWDPVPAPHVAAYAADEMSFAKNWTRKVAELAAAVGGVEGKTVLDLGGGPGHYGLAFARLGASVTWYDVSARYARVARQLFEAEGIEAQFVIGYLDDAAVKLGRTFDLVFNRGCWNYTVSEKRFARTVFQLVSPGGHAYVEAMTSRHAWPGLSAHYKARVVLNEVTGFKIGHPFTPRGRAERYLRAMPWASLQADYELPTTDRLLAARSA